MFLREAATFHDLPSGDVSAFREAQALQRPPRLEEAKPLQCRAERQTDLSAAAENAAPQVYVDLSDLVEHAIWHETLAGIARVQLAVARALLTSNSAVRPFSLHDGEWHDLAPHLQETSDMDAILMHLKQTFGKPRRRSLFQHLVQWPKDTRRKLMRAFFTETKTPIPDFHAQDTLFIGGAFWGNKMILDLAKRASVNGTKLVVLFHDLIPLSHPHFTISDFTREFCDMLRLRAHFIVTSRFNAYELQKARQLIHAEKIGTDCSIVALADEFPGAVRNEAPGEPSQRLRGIAGRDFVLYVGTVEVRKNHHSLLSSWLEMEAEWGEIAPVLVVAGQRGWKADAALAILDNAQRYYSKIVFIEAPSDRELRWLYASCLFTIYPSFYEGWGLPVGESLWFGKPCAASNTSSIPAAGRDLCHYFSPYEPDEMKAAVSALLNPVELQARQSEIRNAALRTWQDVGHDIERVVLGCHQVARQRSVARAFERVAL